MVLNGSQTLFRIELGQHNDWRSQIPRQQHDRVSTVDVVERKYTEYDIPAFVILPRCSHLDHIGCDIEVREGDRFAQASSP